MTAIATVVTAARHSSSGLSTSYGVIVTVPLSSTCTAAPGGRSQPSATTAPCTSPSPLTFAVYSWIRFCIAGTRNCFANAATWSGVFNGIAVPDGCPPAPVSEIRCTVAPAGELGPDEVGAEDEPGSCAAVDDADEPHPAVASRAASAARGAST